MKKQRIWSVLLVAVMLVNTFACAGSVFADEPVEDYVWTDGSLDNTYEIIGEATHEMERSLDGDGATKVVFDYENLGGRIRYSTADGQGVDLSAYNQMTIYLYISNAETIYGCGLTMLHRGDAASEFDMRYEWDSEGNLSGTYANGWNKITFDVTDDKCLDNLCHVFVIFNWHQDRVYGTYFMVDSITFSKVENPQNTIENLGGWDPADAEIKLPDDNNENNDPEPDVPVELSDTPFILIPDTEEGMEMLYWNTWDGTVGDIWLDEGMVGDAIYFNHTAGEYGDMYMTFGPIDASAYNKLTFWAYVDDAESLKNSLNLFRFRFAERDENGVETEVVIADQSLNTLHDWVDGWNLVTLDLSEFVITYSMTSHYKIGNRFPWEKLTDIVWLVRIPGEFTCAIDNMVMGSTLADEGLAFEAPAEDEIGFPENIALGQTVTLPEVVSDASLMQTIVTCNGNMVEIVDGKFTVEDSGDYVIKIVLSDEFNRSITYTATYNIDTKAPSINFIKYFDENNTVAIGTVVDLSKITAADGVDPNPSIRFTVTYNGEQVELGEDLKFTVEATGTYTVEIEAEDASGNVAKQTLTFTGAEDTDPADDNKKNDSDGASWVVIVIIAVAVVAVIAVIVVVLKKKKTA